jgi:hypothetical protein
MFTAPFLSMFVIPAAYLLIHRGRLKGRAVARPIEQSPAHGIASERAV